MRAEHGAERYHANMHIFIHMFEKNVRKFYSLHNKPYAVKAKCFSLAVAETGLKCAEGGEELRKQMHANRSAPPSHIQRIHSSVI